MSDAQEIRVRNAGWVIDLPDGATIHASIEQGKFSKAEAEKMARTQADKHRPCELVVESTTGDRETITRFHQPAEAPQPELPAETAEDTAEKKPSFFN